MFIWNIFSLFQVLQKDIEAHGRIVSSVVKLSEKVSGECEEQQKGNDQQQQDQEQQHPALRVASSLERRWHLLFLRALEWQCHIETLASRTCNKVSTHLFLIANHHPDS